MNPYLAPLLTFAVGSIPFSVWIGRLALQTDIRQYGDGNPGGSNVIRAGGGLFWSTAAVLFDYLKGVVPVALVYQMEELPGWSLVLAALGPILGHAFSPFLKFRGGKALAATFGVWTALTIWLGPLLLGVSLGIWFLLLDVEGWSVILGMLTFLLGLLLLSAGALLLSVWLGNLLIFLWKQREDLPRRPRLRLIRR